MPAYAKELGNNERVSLSDLVITQLVNPGTPVLYGGGAIALEMRYGTSCIGAIESHMLGAGYNQLEELWGCLLRRISVRATFGSHEKVV
jgi:trimethylamine:corrinoid methyltransferase-like protein